jgi:hypothetical protein
MDESSKKNKREEGRDKVMDHRHDQGDALHDQLGERDPTHERSKSER